MSRHTVELPATTDSGRALLVAGYQNGTKGPHFFCYLFDIGEPTATQLWNSMFSLDHMLAQQPDEFDEALSQWGVVMPDFIKLGLAEDWAKNQLNCEYCWQEDGTFEQIF